MSHERQDLEDPLLRALHALPREDLSAAAVSAQRERLRAELARVRERAVLRPARWVNALEAVLLWICGGCVLVRLGMSLVLIVRASM